MGRTCSMHGTDEMHTIFWLVNLKERDHLEDICVDGKILDLILGKQGGKVWTGFIWLRTRMSGRLL